MTNCRCFLLVLVVVFLSFSGVAQRTYRPSSILAAGNFYKISVKNTGIHRIDIPFLNSLGINTSGIASQSIRIFSNNRGMLPEANNGNWVDDLQENALFINDGGDGNFNGTDQAFFYAEGPDRWIKDSSSARFTHQKDLYSDRTFYFLTIGGTGLRVQNTTAAGPSNINVNSFTERYFHELDTVNFLASGREWYGEELANMPGKSLSRDFLINIPNLLLSAPITVSTQCIARSTGGGSRFDLKLNGQPLGQFLVNPVTGGIYDPFAQQSNASFSTIVTQNNLALNFTYVPGSFNAQGWINWFEIIARRQLIMNGNEQLLFRDWNSVGPGNIASFILGNASGSTSVWDVTDPLIPSLIPGTLTGNELQFSNSASRLREYVAFNASNVFIPESIGKVTNQDLHNSSPRDYIIITHPQFLAQAQRLAQFHEQCGLRTLVVSTDQIYNEFGGGRQDPVAIRDFLKMYHDKYRNDPATRLKYLLLFGDGSYDYKDRISNNTNYVLAWENNFSLDPLSTYASDDFYGFLDDNEDINSGLVINELDLGIGRVPSKNIDEAKNFVDKVIAYHSPAAMGPWRNNLTFVADDEDFNLHLQDAEIFTNTVSSIVPVYNQQKIYLDAFRQESGSGGSRYPEANLAINNQIFTGTLLWNYNGHGGARRLAEETILDQESVNSWNNADKLPLFVTATCDFAPYDNPNIQSIGENILLRPKTGGIALMTTTRVVFAFSNRIMNDNYLRIAMQPDGNGKYKSLGEATKEAKNYTYQTSADVTNNRKFTLLGDPAMTIAFPQLKVRATKVNGLPVGQLDTLSAMENVVIEGEITDQLGNILTNYNGTLYPVIFDKPQAITTLANDATSQPATFQVQNNALFKGKASISGGQFQFKFKVPKDINYQFGKGKLSLYAENSSIDAHNSFTEFIIGGIGANTGNDNAGPEIKPFLNDEKFVSGGITNENPVLLIKLADTSGINTAGTGIGHDIIATLDNDNNRFFVLNDFYQSDLDSYQKGTVRFQMPELEPGPHTLRIKAWDVLNNSNEVVIEFTVINDEDLVISRVLNYPNPFTTQTQFWFEHNKPGLDLQVRVQIFTVSGRIIKMIQQTINTAGTRSSELEWNGRDEYGDKIGRGTYLYKLSVTAPGGQYKEKIEKLVVF